MQYEVLQGVVTRFKGNGRKLGYPTANLNVETNLKDGVYFGFVDMGQFSNHPAVIFIGVPTTMGDTDRRVEAYLLDIPDQDYYGEPIKITPRHFHRSNQTFKDIETLMGAIRADETAARQHFSL
jgi:FAD synthase